MKQKANLWLFPAVPYQLMTYWYLRWKMVSLIIEMSELHSIVSYNCHGYNLGLSKLCFVNHLLSRSDILFLQEHWLSAGQLSQLNDINQDFTCISVSGFNNEHVLSGRPYGGCATFYRKSLNVSFKQVACDSRRIVALQMSSTDINCILINVYFPFEDMLHGETMDEFLQLLAHIHNIVEQFQNA